MTKKLPPETRYFTSPFWPRRADPPQGADIETVLSNLAMEVPYRSRQEEPGDKHVCQDGNEVYVRDFPNIGLMCSEE